MGKKKAAADYNDFLDGEKLRDNAHVRTSLQPSFRQDASPPPTRREGKGGKWKGKKGRGGPKQPPLTHFLCLPLVNEQSKERLANTLQGFKEELKAAGVVPLGAVRPVGTLHLTLGVMGLDDEGLEGAGKYLEELDVSGLLSEAATEAGAGAEAAGPLLLNLKALVPMQQPRNTSILYAEPRDVTGRLHPFAKKLRDFFLEKGVLVDDKRPLKLHATIVNTIYAKPGGRARKNSRRDAAPQRQDEAEHSDDALHAGEKESEEGEDEEGIEAPPDASTADTDLASEGRMDRSEGHGPSAKSWIRFDASSIVEQYKDFVWAENVIIDTVQICKMGAKKHYNEQGDIVSEEYECVFSKTF